MRKPIVSITGGITAAAIPILYLLTILPAAPGYASAADPECVPTATDYLGPFYVAGTPVTDDLNRHGKTGQRLEVSGRILSAAPGTAPLPGARVEIWQTDGAGQYYPESDGHAREYADQDIDLRGTIIADETGSYRFRTLVPGAYPPRPRHFHYRVTAPGHVPLVTQLYVTGDGRFRQPGGKCRHAPLVDNGEGFSYNAPDIYLKTE